MRPTHVELGYREENGLFTSLIRVTAPDGSVELYEKPGYYSAEGATGAAKLWLQKVMEAFGWKQG